MSMFKEKPFLTPNDEGLMGTDDAASIQNAIDAASEAGVNKVVIPRYNKRSDSSIWIIPGPVRTPSNMTLILDNCHLQLAEGFVGQMLTNSLSRSEEGKKIAGTQTGINIIGKGEAVIDGGLHNGLTERVLAKNPGPYTMWDNLLLYLHNVREFRVEGFRVINQRWWGLCFMFCSFGKIANIDFDGKGDIPNQDGIDLRCGCHDITIENITGYTGDDIVALTALLGKQMEEPYRVMGCNIDICNIIIKNIKATSRGGCDIVRLLNHDGARLYNILIENISDISVPYTDERPSCAVRIGDRGSYTNVREVMHGETKNITVRNVFTRARYGVAINATLADSLIENIHVHDDGEYAVGVSPMGGKITTTVSNVFIKGIYYNIDQKSRDGSADLEPAEYVGEIFSFENCEGKNIVIRDVFAGKTAHLVGATGEIAIDAADVVIDELSDTLVRADEKAKVTLKNVKVKGEIQK